MFFKIILTEENPMKQFSLEKIAELKKIFRADFSLFEKIPPALKLNKNVLIAAVEASSSLHRLFQADCAFYGKAVAAIQKDTDLMKAFLKWDVYRFIGYFISRYRENKEFITECLADNWCLEPFFREAGLLTKEHDSLLADYAACREELKANNILNWQRFADVKTARLILKNIKKTSDRTFVKDQPVVQLLFSRADWVAPDIVKRQINSFIEQGYTVFYHEITSLDDLFLAQLLIGSFWPIDLRILGGSGNGSSVAFQSMALHAPKAVYRGTEMANYSAEMSQSSLLVLFSCWTGVFMKEVMQKRYPRSQVEAPLTPIYDVEFSFGGNILPSVKFKMPCDSLE